MKSYTNIPQSKKLSEILPLKSADMHYERVYFEGKQSDWFVKLGTPIKSDDIIPCWSLAALLGTMPSVIKRKGKRMFLTLNLYYKSPDRLDELWETKEEPIDACVEMIEFLHKEKLI